MKLPPVLGITHASRLPLPGATIQRHKDATSWDENLQGCTWAAGCRTKNVAHRPLDVFSPWYRSELVTCQYLFDATFSLESFRSPVFLVTAVKPS